MTPEQAGEARRAGIEQRRVTAVGKLVLSLTPVQMRAYDRWQRTCRKLGVPVTPQSRYEYLSDLKEMPSQVSIAKTFS